MYLQLIHDAESNWDHTRLMRVTHIIVGILYFNDTIIYYL